MRAGLGLGKMDAGKLGVGGFGTRSWLIFSWFVELIDGEGLKRFVLYSLVL